MEEKKYKPFDLEKAKAGAEVMTKNGDPVRVICFDRKLPEEYADENIVALVTTSENDEKIGFYNKEGEYKGGWFATLGSSIRDLVMKPIKHEGWANVYRCNDRYVIDGIFDSYEEAFVEKYRSFHELDDEYITTTKIEWKE